MKKIYIWSKNIQNQNKYLESKKKKKKKKKRKKLDIKILKHFRSKK